MLKTMKNIKTIFTDKFKSVNKVSDKHVNKVSDKHVNKVSDNSVHIVRTNYHEEMMQYYEEVLAQSARNYAFTSDKKWEQRYREIEKLSYKLLKDAKQKANSVDSDFFSKMVVSNDKLVKMECAAINLVNDNKPKQAIELLDSEEYLQERKVLSGGLNTFVKEHYEKDSESWIAIKAVNEITALERRLAILGKDLEDEKFITIGTLASRLSHDIRNPLAIIKISFENIKMMYGVNEIQIKQFEKIERSIGRITHQVDDVLDFIREQPLELNKIKFSEIIAESMDSLIVPNDIKIILPKNDVTFVCDRRQFSTVLNNLILNGIQEIGGAGIIEITAEENNDTIVIQVKDSGKGVPKEDLPKIFEPLFTTKQTGTGLGLASVKSILDTHGGTISVTSPPTIFTITLPKTLD